MEVYNSSKEHEIVFGVKMATVSVSCFINIIALLIMFAGGSNRKLLFRLIIYLLLADLLLVIVKILELTPVTYENGHVQVRDGKSWDRLCSVFGYFDELATWMRNLVVIFIVIHLYIVIKRPERFLQAQSETSKILEAVGVCVCFFLPFTFSWIPFVDDCYGLSGHWCWIKNDCGHGSAIEGALYRLFLHHVPLLLVIGLTSCVCVYLLYVVCCKSQNRLRQYEIVLMLLYPIIFNALYLVMTLSRIVSTVRESKQSPVPFTLWILRALASLETLLPSLAVILSLLCTGTRKLLCPRFIKKNSDEERPLIGPHKGIL